MRKTSRYSRDSYQSEWRKANPEKVRATQNKWRKANVGIVRVYKILRQAVKNGTVIKAINCHDCGKDGKLQGHHEDYKKPLKVIWVCAACHKKRHGKDAMVKIKHKKMAGGAQPFRLPILTCNRCGHSWHPKSNAKPIRCAGCKSPYWSMERRILVTTEAAGLGKDRSG